MINFLKTTLKAGLPESVLWRLRSLRFPFQTIRSYFYDMRLFLAWAGASERPKKQAQLAARMMMDAHRIEKGLSLKSARVLFGKQVVTRLLANLERYRSMFGWDPTAQMALDDLFAYYEFNRDAGHDNKDLYETLVALRAHVPETMAGEELGGTIEKTREAVYQAAKMDLRPFLQSRRSIRQFDSRPVDMDLIQQAVAIAQTTPSVCNRQTSRVHVFASEEEKARVLDLQNGSRGFGEQIDKVIVVTSDRRGFVQAGERNQCWVDGGMYAMSLVYALHSLGLGTCCLNWSMTTDIDKKLKRAVNIPDYEAVIMVIGVGHLPERFKVTRSSRKDVSEVMFVH